MTDIVAQLAIDAQKMHDIVHGDDTTVVTTDGGPVRSVAKLIADNQQKIDDAAGVATSLTGPGAAATIATSSGSNVQAELDAKASAADLAAPGGAALIGAAGGGTVQDALDAKATPADVTAAIDALVAGAPAALDTLKELADAVNDDASFAATVTTQLGQKVNSTDLAAAGGAALVGTSDGSTVQAKLDSNATAIGAKANTADLAASGGAMLVGLDGGTVGDALSAVQLADYAALRAYAGSRKSAQVAAAGGTTNAFHRDDADTTSADDGADVIVDANGHRWKRALQTALTATPGWDDVPQIDTTTPLLGGPGGPLNGPAKALLDRTEYLRGLSINVRNYITTAVDGVTVNQTGIASAVAAAYAAAADLEWPAGTYVSDATIPNFHKVRHVGPGVIKRGSTLFYVEPRSANTNTIYVSSAGSSTNDGLSAAQPMLKFQDAFDALRNYGPVLEGTWIVESAACTHDFTGGSQTHSTPSKNRVVIKGPAVGGHPNVPTCLVDGGGIGNAYSHGINCDGIGVRVQVQDIKFQNFREASGHTRIGLVGANGADLYTLNVHGFECTWAVINAKECEQFRASGGILDCNNVGSYGCISDSSHSSFGYNAGSLAGGPIVKKALSAGVYWSTGSQGHCDWTNFEDCAVGFLCAENSRADTVGNSYKRNTVAKRAQTGGWFASGGASETFNDGTADANTTNVEFKAFSGDIAEGAAQGSGSWTRVAFDRTARALTGTAATTLTTPYTIAAGRMKGVGKSCRVHAFGVFTQATAGSVVNVVFGGMTVAFTVPAAATNLAFEIDCELHEAAGGYRAFGKLTQGLNGVRMGYSSSGFVNTADQAVSISATLAGSGDSLNVYRTDVFMIG